MCFGTEGFPEDLSIVATLRPAQGVNSVLFAVYNDAGDEQLVVSVGKTVSLHYHEGEEEGTRHPPLQVDFGVRMNDGKSVQLPVLCCSMSHDSAVGSGGIDLV